MIFHRGRVLTFVICFCFCLTRLKKTSEEEEPEKITQKEGERGDSVSLVSQKDFCLPCYPTPFSKTAWTSGPFLFFLSHKIRTHASVSLFVVSGKCLQLKYLHLWSLPDCEHMNALQRSPGVPKQLADLSTTTPLCSSLSAVMPALLI